MDVVHIKIMRNKQAVHDLQFNVSQLLKETTGANRHHKVDSKALNKLDKDNVLVAPLVGDVRFLRVRADILVTGQLESTIEKSCGRCLVTFQAPILIDIEEQFYPTVDITTGTKLPLPDDADDGNSIDGQHILDLLDIVRQGLLLEGYGILYCKPECAGLCPQCGQDRNVGPCDCEDNVIDLRWAGLQALKIED